MARGYRSSYWYLCANLLAVLVGTVGLFAVLFAADPQAGSATTVIAAGDIADCGQGGERGSGAALTAHLIEKLPGLVLALGDLAYESGAKAEFEKCYESTWGRFKSRTRPAPGNHEYQSRGAHPYYAYWGQAAGQNGEGFYSFDLGDWHLVALNSNILGTALAAKQEAWLIEDLDHYQGRCMLAFFHHPRFTSGWHGDDSRLNSLWRILYASNVDVVLNGHEHNYERFAPLDPTGHLDERRGIREFIVGTGGARLIQLFPAVHPHSEVRMGASWGVLALALESHAYRWQFLSAPEGRPLDQGVGLCHGVR